jgi:hypothetical protein
MYQPFPKATRVLAVGVLAISAALAACATPLAPEQQALVAQAGAAGATDVSGKALDDGGLLLGGRLEGDQFALAIPKNWNHEAVLFAHGYTIPGTPVDVQVNPLAKDPTGVFRTPYGEGFAVGHSAYDKSGIAVASAVENTHRLRGFVGQLGTTRAYMIGASMGGNIVEATVEVHPQDFAGALAGCGVVDNWNDGIGWQIEVRAAYEYFTRGTKYAVPGNADISRSGLSSSSFAALRYLQIYRIAKPILKLFDAAKKNPGGPESRIIDNVVAITHAERDPAMFVLPIGLITLGMDDMTATFGGSVWDNTQKVYHSPRLSDDENAKLNAGIQRIKADPAALDYAKRWHEASGQFQTKLMTVYNTIDSLVPPQLQEAPLKAAVERAGNGANLVQRGVPPVQAPLPLFGTLGYAHCGFSEAQMKSAFDDLRRWVETGARP